MKLDYVTEEQIRQRIVSEFQSRAAGEKKRVETASEGTPTKPNAALDPALVDTPMFERWIQLRVEDARRRGRLVTSQQAADLRIARVLMQGDRVRYVGPAQRQVTDAGHACWRKTGEEGRIVKVEKGPDGQRIFTFLPGYPKAALEPGGPDIHLAALRVKEGTPGYFLLERIP